jgi:hypothetical protein
MLNQKQFLRAVIYINFVAGTIFGAAVTVVIGKIL